MTDKQMVAFDNLPSAVADWRTLDKDALLDIGDRLNDVHKRLQLVIGAWLYVYEDELGYGAMTELAERFAVKPQTLRQWKHVYQRTKNVDHGQHLPYGKLREVARIPSDRQDAWIESATTMKRAELRAAVSAAKVKDDWTPPAGDIVLSPKPSSTLPEYRHVFSRLYWRRKRD